MTAVSRHAAMCGTIAAPGIAAGSADAKLISLCHHLVALEDEVAELFDRRTTIAEEEATENEMDALYVRKDALMAQLDKVEPPTTMAGIVAVARAALATHYHRDLRGTAIASDDSHWLLLMACEALTEG
jgi:hypothetical protein